ncbi:MAG: LuxR C-terminal-related transcriptional regulator [Acidimicrobiales bacterium]
MGDQGELLGRASELAAALRSLTGRSRGIVVTGSPGIGRSAFLRAVGEQVSAPVVVELTATRQMRSRALWTAAPLLDATAPSDLPDFLRVREPLHFGVAAERDDRVPLVVVDDAHFADARSAALVQQLVAARHVRVALSVPHLHHAPEAVRRLIHDQQLVAIELGPLSQAVAGELLLQAGLAEARDDALSSDAWALSAGHPLLALAVARDARRGPGEHREVVEATRRIFDRCGGAARRAAEFLAAGGPISAEMCEQVGVGGGLRRLVAFAFAQGSDDDGGYVLAPRALTIGSRELLGAHGIRECCRRLLEGGDAHTSLVAQARWRLGAQRRATATWWMDAAREAGAANDARLRLACAEAAVAASAGAVGELERARALSALGRGADADAILARLHTTSDDERVRTDALAARAWNLGFVLQRPSDADELLAAAERTTDDAVERAELVCLRASLTLHDRGPGVALAAAEALHAKSVSFERAARVVETLAPALSLQGRWEESEELARSFLDGPARTTASSLTRLRLAVVRKWAQLQTGQFDDVMTSASAASTSATASGALGDAAVWQLTYGYCALLAGRVRTAEDALANAELGLRDVDLFGYLPLCLASRGRARALLSEGAAAEAAFDEADRLVASSHPFTALDTAPDRAYLAACRGDIATAAALVDGAVTRAVSSGHAGVAVRHLWELAMFGRAVDAVHYADAIAGRVQGALAATIVSGLRAIAERDASGVLAASEHFANIGAMMHAHAAAQLAATMFDDAGRSAMAAHAACRAAALLAQCEGARSPLPFIAGRVWLTAREQQVAALAANGATNQAIAASLRVSVRTVETHLHRVYFKLAVSGRAELAAAWSR